jgi:hypothetical protein
MRRRKGWKSAAISSVVTTMSSGCCASPPTPADQRLRADHPHDIDGRQNRRHRAIDQRAVDDDVHVIEPIFEDADARSNGQHDDTQREADIRERAVLIDRDEGQDKGHGHERHAVDEPLDALALLVLRANVADDDGDDRSHRERHEEGADYLIGRAEEGCGARNADRVYDRRPTLVDRTRHESGPEREGDDSRDIGPEDEAPARRG